MTNQTANTEAGQIPEAPIHFDNNEAAAWQQGYESGRSATLAGLRPEALADENCASLEVANGIASTERHTMSKTHFGTLVASSTPGEMCLYKHDDVLQLGIGPDCGMTRNAVVHWMGFNHVEQKRQEKHANARRLALSWNHFPQAVELLKKVEQGTHWLTESDFESIRALLETIEKEAE